MLSRRAVKKSWLAALVPAFALVACGVEAEDGDDEPVGESESAATTVWYTPITKEYFLPSAKVATEQRKLFKSEAEWVAFFGKPSPGIDFTRKWAIFYTPGTERADLVRAPGYQAKLSRVSLSSTGATLSITTKLEMNDPACGTRRTRPFITATIDPPASAPPYKRFYRADAPRTCE